MLCLPGTGDHSGLSVASEPCSFWNLPVTRSLPGKAPKQVGKAQVAGEQGPALAEKAGLSAG